MDKVNNSTIEHLQDLVRLTGNSAGNFLLQINTSSHNNMFGGVQKFKLGSTYEQFLESRRESVSGSRGLRLSHRTRSSPSCRLVLCLSVIMVDRRIRACSKQRRASPSLSSLSVLTWPKSLSINIVEGRQYNIVFIFKKILAHTHHDVTVILVLLIVRLSIQLKTGTTQDTMHTNRTLWTIQLSDDVSRT